MSKNWISVKKPAVTGLKMVEKNPESGEFRVKMQYAPPGTTKVTSTGWIYGENLDDAVAAGRKLRASLLKTAKVAAIEEQEAKKKSRIKAKTVSQGLTEYLESLKESMDNPRKKRESYKSKYTDVRAIRDYHTPEDILNTKIRDLDSSDISRWIKYMDGPAKGAHKELSGRTVKRLKSMLKGALRWLYDSGDIRDDELFDRMMIRFANTKTKQLSEGAVIRNWYGIAELEKIKDFYQSQPGGLGPFRNFCWYVFFQVLFFTGLRVEEIVALQWKNVNFAAADGMGEIEVLNAITQNERRKDAISRTKRGLYKTKNGQSRRILTMLGAYRALLRDYREAYEFEFAGSDIQEGFVFPRTGGKLASGEYQKHEYIRNELTRVSSELGIPYSTPQMFRHAAVTFLLKDMRLSAEDVCSYFGHQDDEMIMKVYSELSLRDNMKKANLAMKDLITQADLAEIYRESDDQAMAKLLVGSHQEEAISAARKDRLKQQILRAYEKNQKEFILPHDFDFKKAEYDECFEELSREGIIIYLDGDVVYLSQKDGEE